MAASYSKVELMGTIQSAPMMRTTPYGEQVCVFAITVVQQVVTAFGRTIEETLTAEIEVGERLAATMQGALVVGQMVMVEGRLRQYPLQPRGRMTVVLADALQVLGADNAPMVEPPFREEEDPAMYENMQAPAEGEQLPF